MAKKGFGAAVGYGRKSLHKPKAAQAGNPSYGSGANGLPGVQGVNSDGTARVAPQPQALPPDWQQQAAELSNGRNLRVGTAQAAWQNANTTYDTGYNAQGQRDYSNPYNQAALLDESYKRSKLATTNGYAGQGQLHSGGYGRMQGENARNFSIDSNNLQTSAARSYQGTGFQQALNLANYGTGNDSGAFDAIIKALGG